METRAGYKGQYRNIAQVWRNGVRKAKAQLELKTARDIKGKSLYHCVNSRRINQLLKGVGDLVPMDADKTEVLTSFLASEFTNKPRPLCLDARVK